MVQVTHRFARCGKLRFDTFSKWSQGIPVFTIATAIVLLVFENVGPLVTYYAGKLNYWEWGVLTQPTKAKVLNKHRD